MRSVNWRTVPNKTNKNRSGKVSKQKKGNWRPAELVVNRVLPPNSTWSALKKGYLTIGTPNLNWLNSKRKKGKKGKERTYRRYESAPQLDPSLYSKQRTNTQSQNGQYSLARSNKYIWRNKTVRRLKTDPHTSSVEKKRRRQGHTAINHPAVKWS